LVFFVPLALSWLFMAVESPISVGIISRLPDSVANTASFFMLMAIALWIESPVIDLLSTATTLAIHRRAYRSLRAFTLSLIALVTLVHSVVALTPLYSWITLEVLDVPPHVAAAGRVAMVIMIPWSGFIGWRRFLQGVLIRYGKTRAIGAGTTVRVATMGLVGTLLFWVTPWSGVEIAASALIASVIMEALFIHLVSRRVVADLPDSPGDSGLTATKLVGFHAPLTATTMMMMLGTPIVAGALARSTEPVLSMAAWQVATTLLFLHRTVTFALPEVVIALYRSEQARPALRSFCLRVGAGSSALLVVFGLMGVDRLFFASVLNARPQVVEAAHVAYLMGAGMPLIGAAQSYLRGLLTAHHLTIARLVSILVAIGVLFACLAIGVAMSWPPMLMAPIALTISTLCELGVLAGAWMIGRRLPNLQPVH
jgi:hypothetical protein